LLAGRRHVVLKVNGTSFESARLTAADAFEIWRRRSSEYWTLDLSLLDDMGVRTLAA
jgi:hypothetical protein